MNPTIKKFLEKHEDITVLGLYWAGMWRFAVLYMLGAIIFGAILAIFDK